MIDPHGPTNPREFRPSARHGPAGTRHLESRGVTWLGWLVWPVMRIVATLVRTVWATTVLRLATAVPRRRP
jgi:hypothetical protein